MVTVLVIPDGAAEPLGPRTSLERAPTPAMDRMAATGELLRVRTVPAGLPPGSEVGIPTLLGVPLTRAPGRGAVEAAAVDVSIPPGHGAHRLDLPRIPDDPVAAAWSLGQRLGAPVVHLRDRRFLLVTPEDDPSGRLARTGIRAEVWGSGPAPSWPPLADTVVVAAPTGAAAGVARSVGAALVSPSGATGQPGSDLRAKTRAALVALGEGARLVVVHVGGPDEAAHARNAAAKRAALADIDQQVVAPLLAAAPRHGATVVVCPDHATDPRDGRHGAAPVPACWWDPARHGPLVSPARDGHYSERTAARRPVVDGHLLLELPAEEVAA